MVIDKPMCVPVHMTVDNRLENVAWCVKEAMVEENRRKRMMPHQQWNCGEGDASNGTAVVSSSSVADGCANAGGENGVYVSTPQRLDQNTSGLLVVATSKDFARYYATLLRCKTEQQLLAFADASADKEESRPASSSSGTADGQQQHQRRRRPQTGGGIHKLYRWYVH
jgi:23S rRNA-/tRNA-specific pseudouridylate synthase